MKNIKYILFFILFTPCFGVKTSRAALIKPAGWLKEKKINANSNQNLSEDTKDKIPFFKKLYKPKGREVSSLDLSKFDFSQSFSFTIFYQCSSKKTNSFQLHYSPGKRGPPLSK